MIRKKWTCDCSKGFEFKVEDNNPNFPLKEILEIVLSNHKTDKCKITESDLEVEENK